MIALFWFLAFLEEDTLLVLKYVELLSESTTYYVVRTSKVRTFYVIMSCYLFVDRNIRGGKSRARAGALTSCGMMRARRLGCCDAHA